MDFARSNPESECWRRFNAAGLWDDKRAADRARLEFSRGLIRKFVVQIVTPDGRREPVRGIVSLSEERGKGAASYTLRAEVISDDERLERMRRDAREAIESAARRFIDVIPASVYDDLLRVARLITMDEYGGGYGDMEVAAAANEG